MGDTGSVERRPAGPGHPPLELVRSRRRRRTASARAVDGRIVVRLPAGLPAEEERRMVDNLVRRVTGAARAAAAGGDAELARRARRLADRYVDGVRPASVAWSSRMQSLWGSCTPSQGSIRISQRLAAYPRYVLDAVLVHELAHLLVRGHPPEFHEIVRRYPDAARADGFLEGVRFAAGQPPGALPDAGTADDDCELDR